MVSENKDYLIEVKRGCHTLEEARELAVNNCKQTKDLKDSYMNTFSLKINRDVEDGMNSVLLDIMKFNFQSELGV